MYSDLSKKEKEMKLAQARKRAVQWSAQQQTRAALRKTSSLKRSSTPTNLPSNIDTSDHSIDLSFNTPIPLSDNRTNTIQAIQDTLKDLKTQREAIDTTIQVLNQRLQFLLNEPKSRWTNRN